MNEVSGAALSIPELTLKLEILEGHNGHLSTLSDRLTSALNRLGDRDTSTSDKSGEGDPPQDSFSSRLDNNLTKTAALCNEFEASVSELERLV